MKRTAQLILAVCLVISFSGFALADSSQSFQLIGREVFPGINLDGKTVGALFVGKFFDADGEQGQFSVSLDHNGENIEVCKGETELIRFKLIMSFNAGGRLVLVGPSGPGVAARWEWNDPAGCPTLSNCPLISHDDYINLLSRLNGDPPSLSSCGASDGPSFIAEVPPFEVVKQRLGSYGIGFTIGSIQNGWLVHTPVVSPAIFGIVALQ